MKDECLRQIFLIIKRITIPELNWTYFIVYTNTNGLDPSSHNLVNPLHTYLHVTVLIITEKRNHTSMKTAVCWGYFANLHGECFVAMTAMDHPKPYWPSFDWLIICFVVSFVSDYLGNIPAVSKGLVYFSLLFLGNMRLVFLNHYHTLYQKIDDFLGNYLDCSFKIPNNDFRVEKDTPTIAVASLWGRKIWTLWPILRTRVILDYI